MKRTCLLVVMHLCSQYLASVTACGGGHQVIINYEINLTSTHPQLYSHITHPQLHFHITHPQLYSHITHPQPYSHIHPQVYSHIILPQPYSHTISSFTHLSSTYPHSTQPLNLNHILTHLSSTISSLLILNHILTYSSSTISPPTHPQPFSHPLILTSLILNYTLIPFILNYSPIC